MPLENLYKESLVVVVPFLCFVCHGEPQLSASEYPSTQPSEEQFAVCYYGLLHVEATRQLKAIK